MRTRIKRNLQIRFSTLCQVIFIMLLGSEGKSESQVGWRFKLIGKCRWSRSLGVYPPKNTTLHYAAVGIDRWMEEVLFHGGVVWFGGESPGHPAWIKKQQLVPNVSNGRKCW